MESTIKKVQNKPASYPYMGQYSDKDGTMVVLFTSFGCGVIVHSTMPKRCLRVFGDFSDAWDETVFHQFTDIVELKG